MGNITENLEFPIPIDSIKRQPIGFLPHLQILYLQLGEDKSEPVNHKRKSVN